jgi:hypothetical protein
MTSFVHVDQPQSHPGVVRAEAFIERVRATRKSLDGARGLAALLLAAIVSSLLVVADKLMATWSDEGGLLVAWVVLWAVAFLSLALFAGSARSFAARAVTAFRAHSRRRAAERADEEFMAYAKFDQRILRDLQAISTRQEATDEAVAAVVAQPQRSIEIVAKRSADVRVPTLYEAMRRVNLGKYY